MLCQSNANNQISSYAYLQRQRDFATLPFVPIGIESLIHEKKNRRKTWGNHVVMGWVLGTSTEHYCCWRLWVKKMRATRISGMVSFKHKYISNPTVTPSDPVLDAAQDMTDTLQGRMQCHLGDDDLQSLLNLQKIFTKAAMNQKAADTPVVPSHTTGRETTVNFASIKC